MGLIVLVGALAPGVQIGMKGGDKHTITKAERIILAMIAAVIFAASFGWIE
jgi:hypothetical protein